MLSQFPNSVAVSAKLSIGLEALLDRIETVLAAELVPVKVLVPYARGELVAIFHEQGTVAEMSHNKGGTVLEGHLPRRWLERFRAYLV
jgi:GTP-binding protein HflX